MLVTVLCALVSLFGLTDLDRLIQGNWSAKVASINGRRIVAVQQTSFVVDRFPTLLRPGLMAFGGPAVWSVVVVILALAVVAPLPLAARYPLLGWRIGLAGLLLVPLVCAWWGGWPWGPGADTALLGVFCVAGLRQRRPELWWMWALSLIPWWL